MGPAEPPRAVCLCRQGHCQLCVWQTGARHDPSYPSCGGTVLGELTGLGTLAPSRMCDRNSGRRLRQWLIEQIDSEMYPGLIWENEEKTMFRIPWKHAGKQDYNQEVDASIFKVGTDINTSSPRFLDLAMLVFCLADSPAGGRCPRCLWVLHL